MSAPAQTWSQEAEMQFLEGLRQRYEAEGFDFKVAPERDELPSFLGSYVPDAVARKPGLNIAIEVKRYQSPVTQTSLQKIRRLFDGRDDWQLNVVFMGTEPLQSVRIQPSQPATIRKSLNEIVALKNDGYYRAAFVLGWSLLEGALHSLDGDSKNKPLTPGTVVQTLAMNGHIEPDTERRMRELVQLRNRIVHGDLNAEPTSAEVQIVLSVTEQLLAAYAS